MGQQWTAAGAGALGAADLAMAKVLLGEVPLPHHRAARTYTGQGNKLLAGKNRTLCAPGPRKKEQ